MNVTYVSRMELYWHIHRHHMVAAPLPPPAPRPILGGDLKISDQNNWVGKPKQKIKFGGELNLKGDLKFQRGAYEPQ